MPTCTPKRLPAKAWYAVYTASRAEKKVKERLDQHSIENYLPLQVSIRRWSDRKKRVELPLIRGYIFVHVTAQQYAQTCNIPGVVSFLKEGGKPAPIPDWQINTLRVMNEGAESVVEVSTEEIPTGTYVRVVSGKLAGLEGELVEHKGKHKVLIRIDHLGCALTDIASSCIERYYHKK
ncbi:MAG: UpxY family transcription antiterminator [Odoribacteraceae bacterium]|jgi:transcription antitermination factor NusG|nr:UpxY family transcription antiterminator [Odoribacteraceae bacterium]